ncbi:copper chaperone PCu(A)C [Rhodoferax bucti]|uniref:copper chaperone PCu(A)C n=1 Tax=Rhodoferax bucti TaxID=2576305 RepID=UPI001476F3BE|nr:copper chaperone PCu(A)C [Rhodoferax bucti]
MKLIRKVTLLVLVEACFVTARAQVVATDAWVRPGISNESSTPVYMSLVSSKDTRLISARSTVAEVVEVHGVAQDKGGKTIHPVVDLKLLAGKPLEFKPDGYHLALTDIKKPIRAGFEVQITLIFQSADGTREVVYVHAPVSLTKPK